MTWALVAGAMLGVVAPICAARTSAARTQVARSLLAPSLRTPTSPEPIFKARMTST
jgi:hypothetical protein